jgi:hypothetical protein
MGRIQRHWERRMKGRLPYMSDSAPMVGDKVTLTKQLEAKEVQEDQVTASE